MELKDIKKVPIPEELLEKATAWAKALDRENAGEKTLEGGVEKNIKGCIGQWAVHALLDSWNWPHKYSEPYQKDLHGDDFDIKVAGEVWDVKCRNKWNEEYFYNIEALFTEQEKEKECDYYIVCTPDEGMKNVYILGAISYQDLWDNLKPAAEGRSYRFEPAGRIFSHNLSPFHKFVFRV